MDEADIRQAQYRALIEEARAQPTNHEERGRLVLPAEEVEKPKQSGALIL